MDGTGNPVAARRPRHYRRSHHRRRRARQRDRRAHHRRSRSHRRARDSSTSIRTPADGLRSAALHQGQPLIAQGVTTVIANPDGGGPVDLAAQRAALEAARPAPNVALLIGHGVRAQRGDGERAARADGGRAAEDEGSRPPRHGRGGVRPVVRTVLRAGQLREDRRGDRAHEGRRRSSAASTPATCATRGTTTPASGRRSAR